MSWWKNVQDRSGWTATDHSTKVWIVWFLLLVGISIPLEVFVSLSWVYLIAIAIIVRFIAKYIVGPKTDKEDNQ